MNPPPKPIIENSKLNPLEVLSEKITVELETGEWLRVDKFLSHHWGLLSRSQLKQRQTRLVVNGEEAKPSKKICKGSIIEVFYLPPDSPDYTPEEMVLDVIFENSDVLVINKPQGLVVHPAAGNTRGTLVHGLLYRYGRENFHGRFDENNLRPGIVHRLDKDTSGVLITAKNPAAQESLARQFREKTAEKRYIALMKGSPYPRKGRVDNFLIRDPRNRKRFTWRNEPDRGKQAITDYQVMKEFGRFAFVSLYPKTGRTHQLRVHAVTLGNPILGDPIYGRQTRPLSESLMLHAYSLNIRLPGEETPRTFRAPLPGRFRRMIRP